MRLPRSGLPLNNRATDILAMTLFLSLPFFLIILIHCSMRQCTAIRVILKLITPRCGDNLRSGGIVDILGAHGLFALEAGLVPLPLLLAALGPQRAHRCILLQENLHVLLERVQLPIRFRRSLGPEFGVLCVVDAVGTGWLPLVIKLITTTILITILHRFLAHSRADVVKTARPFLLQPGREAALAHFIILLRFFLVFHPLLDLLLPLQILLKKAVRVRLFDLFLLLLLMR